MIKGNRHKGKALMPKEYCSFFADRMVRRNQVKNKNVYYGILHDFMTEVQNAILEGKQVTFPGASNGTIYLAIHDVQIKGKLLKRSFLKNGASNSTILDGIVKPVLEGAYFWEHFKFWYLASHKRNMKPHVYVKHSERLAERIRKMPKEVRQLLIDLR